MTSPFIATPFIDPLLIPQALAPGWRTTDGILDPANPLAWSVRETNFAGAIPTGDPVYPYISPPGPGVNQQDSIGYVPAIPGLYDQHDGQHQVWPNAAGQNSDRLLGLEGGPLPDPILYHIRDQMAEHSFTSSRVIPIVVDPITRVATPVPPEDLPAGVILDENGTAELPWSTIYSFNGTFPGPMINAEYGKPILVRFENDLDLNPLGLDRQDFGDPQWRALTHLHNAHTAPESDGNSAYMQQNDGGYLPGQWADNLYLNYPAGGDPNQKQSFFWYHDHVHYSTGDNVYKGKVGLNIIYDPDLDPGDERDEGINGNALHLPGIKTVNPDGSFDVNYDIPMAFFDVELDDGVTIHDHEDHHFPLPPPETHPEWWGKSAYVHDPNHGFVGDIFTVNGTAFPVLEVAQRQYRLRFLDASVARIYELTLMTSETGPVAMPGTDGQWQIPDGQLWRPLTQIATMGGLLPAPIERDSIQIWPAGRSEHIVDFSDVPTGTVIYITNILEMDDGRKPDFNDPEDHVNYAPYKVPMVKIIVGGPPPEGEEGPTSIPTTLRPQPFAPPQEVLDTLPQPEFTLHRSGTFGGQNQWIINDLPFDPLKPLHTVTRGEPEVWTVTNGSDGWVHPMHMHMEEHIVLHRELSTNLHPDDLGKSDTVNLDENESVTFYRNFRTFTGRYVAHCHNLAHEDHSMMFRWDIEEPEIPTTPVSAVVEEAAGQADPTNTSPIHFTVVFSEPVTGFDSTDVALNGSAGATTAVVSAANGTPFNTTFDVAVSGMTHDGTVNVRIPAGVAQNALAQFNSASLLATVIFDTIRPAVVIDRHPIQDDPTGTSMIRFRVVFTEPVTGFEPDDMILSGTAGPTTTDVTGNGTTYTVIVSGTLGAGPVTASIPAGVAQDAAGNLNTASPSDSVPTVVGFAKMVAENAMISFTPEEFISHFSDPTGDSLLMVRITALPMHGSLLYEGLPLTSPGLEIPVGDVNWLFYMPAMHYSGYDNFSWDGSDGLVYSGVPAKIGIIVDAPNSDIVTEWNQVLAAGLNAPYGQQRGGRTLAMMHSAMHDAIMALGGGYDPYYVTLPAPAGASMEAAATAAAYTVLYSVFTTPVERAVIQARYDSHLSAIPDGSAETDGIAFGQSVGQAILALRSNDGAAAAMITPHPDGTLSGEWRRTASGNPMAPGWGNVTPWVITSSDQFDQGGPPALDSTEYATAYEEVMTIGDVNATERTADQTAAVIFWVDHIPAKWYAVARDISGREGLSLVENARLYELLSLTMADTAIAVWDMKYNYNFWRPETAIHEGDSDLNDDTVGDPTWQSLIPAPAFPSYVSGHSTTSAAAAKALELYFGTGDYMFHLGGGHSHGGSAPQPRMFTSFQQAAEEAGMSRIWGGIHFQFENQDGLQAGRELAEYVYATMAGDTTPPTVTVNQAAGQANPTTVSPISFTVVFSEPVVVGSFTAADVTLGGTAGATTAVVSTTDNITFNVAVSGMTQDGTVVSSIAAGAAQDAAGNVNTASTSGDNSVSFVVGPLPQAVPLTQNFTAGLPGVAQGWEYFSTGEGRIQVTNGQLRLDDRVNNNVFSLNEAILHVNLAGRINVQLQLNHQRSSDQTHRLTGTQFSGHVNADLIAVSVNGANWVKVTDLTTNFTARTFALDTLLQQAAAAAGSTDLSNVRIKLQQYDNAPWGTDGRGFDNVVVTGIIPAPEIDVLGNNLSIPDGDTTPGVADFTDFGGADVNGQTLVSTRVFTIRNTGTAALNLTGNPRVVVTGAQADDFTVTVQPTSSVAPNGTTTFEVVFQPSALGLRQATINIASDDADESLYDFVIQGTGVALVAQATPYSQNFTAGLPGLAQGWEYFSTNEGRIQVTNGQLRLDDRVNNNVFSLNEAILHVNLAGQTNVQLQLNHQRSSDQTHGFAGTQFTGHVNADLIAVSVNGTNWVKVTDLTTNFTARTFALDTLLQQAAAAAGSTDLSNVRIKLQQYDNAPWGTDGRGFDNVQVTGTAGAPLLAAAVKAGAAGPGAKLDSAALEPLAQAAIADWASRGLPAELMSRLRQAEFVVTDLPGSYLAMAVGNTIYIDADAAGHGWFVDRTPSANEEFRGSTSGGDLRAVDRRAVDRIDLLTVVAHELGHLAGLDDLDHRSGSLMSSTLPAGVRRTDWNAAVDKVLESNERW